MNLERDLRDYLYENPDILFQTEPIKQKRKEVYIEGRFIDLLFEVGGVYYIVELKRDTIRREQGIRHLRCARARLRALWVA